MDHVNCIDEVVSVIIPVYNAEKYLRECLDSVVSQSLNEIEIICIDDGSIDKSNDILHEYQTNDTRFMIIEHCNKGAAIARNEGIMNASGDFVIFLDSDDYYPSEYVLEKLVITGKTPLKGEVIISGAKNAAVAILPATLLINGICTIENLPNISDVKLYCDILEKLGVKIYIGHNAKQVPQNAVVIASTAIREDNPELVRAKELGLEVLHRSDLLSRIAHGQIGQKKEYFLKLSINYTYTEKDFWIMKILWIRW